MKKEAPKLAVSSARAAAFEILMRVEQQAAFASALLHARRLANLSSSDHALVTELVMGVLRWQSRIDAAIAEASSQAVHKLDPEVLTALRLGVYQLGWLERVPPRAAIHESVQLVKIARKRSAAGFVNAILRKLAAGKSWQQKSADDRPSANCLAERLAHPAWLVDRWVAAFGIEVARKICEYDQHSPVTAVRFRTPSAEREIDGTNLELAPGALLKNARRVIAGDITRTTAFQQRHVVIQDEASQLVAALLGTSMSLLDCCAAPGSKTSAFADRNPDATVVAADLHPHRARLLRRLLGNAGHIHIIAADARALPVGVLFDRVLADVPCSGTGTLARNPEIKWRLQPADLMDLHGRQVAILTAALTHLAPGGRLIYSTCSLEPEENELVVREVMGTRPDFRILDCAAELRNLHASCELAWQDLPPLTAGLFLRTAPGLHPCDGFFAAMIERL